jgi:phosphatidate cytidylyltransferase
MSEGLVLPGGIALSTGQAVVGASLVGLLVFSSLLTAVLMRLCRGETAQRTLADARSRIRAWWIMALLVLGALFAGTTTTLVLFGLISFLALREFITLTPTRRSDHRTLFWAFFVITPLQYVIIAWNWYGLFAIFIPVWCLWFVAIRSLLTGDASRYLERAAKIQWGLMTCVYGLSHLPALTLLHIPGYGPRGIDLLLWLLVTVQLSDVFQYVWGKLFGRHRIAPHLSPNKTWEGGALGVATACGVATGLWWLTPYTPFQALAMACAVTLAGFFGGLVMSAIKRDTEVKDFGHLLPGHGGILDRVDSLLFAAPVLFHITRYFLDRPVLP